MTKEFDWLVPDTDVFFWKVSIQVGIDGFSCVAGGRENAVGTLDAIDDMCQVGEDIQDGQVVLNDDDTLLFC